MTCDSGFRIPGFRVAPNKAVDGVGERERGREREIGDSETNIFKPNQTIGSKVTLSSFGNL